MILSLVGALILQDPQSCGSSWQVVAALEGAGRPDTTAVADSLAATPAACDRAVAAYLRALSPLSGAEDWRRRLDVQTELEHAIGRQGSDPRLLLALGYLRYQQGVRVDARRIIERALDRFATANSAPTRRERAVAVHVLGRLLQDEWRDWRSFGHLRGLSTGRWNCAAFSNERDALTSTAAGAASAALTVEKPGPVDINIECPALFESIMDSDFLSDSELKRDARDGLERRFREAIEQDPAYWPPWQALASELVYESRWPDVERLARDAARTFPDDFRPTALLALVAYRQDQPAGAAALFDSALAATPDEIAALYRQPALVLSVAEERAFAAQPEAQREQLGGAYWRSRRVSFLSDGNDRVLEHYARLTEADAIFTIPSLEIAGWNTAPGSAWIRYGRPRKIRDLAVENGRASFWTYGPDPDLVFTRLLTYAEFRVHEYFAGQMQLMHERLPTRFRPPDVDSVVPIAHQIARFRGDSGNLDLVVVAAAGDALRGGSARVEAGVTLLDAEFREVARWRGRTLPRRSVAVTLRGLRPGQPYNLAVELKDPEHRILRQGRDTLTADLGAGRPMLSDLLLVGEVGARDGLADSRADLDVRHLAGRVVPAGANLGLVWEVYDLALDSAGAWRYRVRIELRDAEGRSFLARLLDGGRRRSPTAAIEFDRTRPAAGDRAVEWLNLTGDWKPGRYQVTLRIEDLATSGTATATTGFSVEAGPADRPRP
jgi:GWxTD domain-containing protein